MRHVNPLSFLAGLAILAVIIVPAYASDEAEGWSAELALKVKRVGNVRVSPDGSRVAYEVGIAKREGEDSQWVTHIHVSDRDGSNTFQLTQGKKSCTSAQWSPDGQWIAFLSERGGEKTSIWRIRTDGGEAERLTEEKGGISGFKFSPDGSQIAFTMTDPPTEDDEKNTKEKSDARVMDENLKYSRLYVMPTKADESGARQVRKLTEENYNVSGGFFGGAFDWAPDGNAIAFVHTKTPKIDDWPTADISIVEVTSGSVRPLVSTGAAETSPTYSPDGRSIAFTVSDDPPTWAFTSRVHVISPRGSEFKSLAGTFDRQPNILGWNEKGDAVLVSEAHRTMNRIYLLPLDGSKSGNLTPPSSLIDNPILNRSRQYLGFTAQSSNRPAEAFISPIASYGNPTQVSQVQDLPDLPIGATEVINWTSKDGMEIEGLLTYPALYRPGTTVPLLVIVHGGPTGVFTQSFIANRGAYPIAAFASRGFAILRCNPRGSSGYGKDFRYANYDDWGGGDYQDIMSGVDHVIDMGVADADRLGIMGWSYGGYMTSWVITQTDRFKVASVGAGVTNLMSFNGTSDIPGFIPDYFHGDSWEKLDAYRKHSAMFNVGGVTTPTLIQHGEKDVRVPISQGYELYNALRRQGVEVKMVVYPRQPHGIREPKLQLDAMKRNLEWFDRLLDDY